LIVYPVAGFALADKGGLEWGRICPLTAVSNKKKLPLGGCRGLIKTSSHTTEKKRLQRRPE